MQEMILTPCSSLYEDVDHYHNSKDIDFYNFYVEHDPRDVHGVLQDRILLQVSKTLVEKCAFPSS